METENLTSGKLLKRIRKALGLRQHEIVGNEITRNLVSMIENGKTPLNPNIANLIIRNINSISKERNLNVTLVERDLIVPGLFEAKQQAQQYEEQLDKKDFADIAGLVEEVSTFLNKWDIPEQKAIIFSKFGEIFFSKAELYRSYMYYIKGFENAVRISDYTLLGNASVRLMHICIKLQKYQECIEISNSISSDMDNLYDESVLIILYNKALAHLYLSEYDLCISTLDELERKISKNELARYLDIMILKAICFKRKGQYETALAIYYYLINDLEIDLVDKKVTIYGNMMEIYSILENSSKVIEHLHTIITLLDDLEPDSICLVRAHIEVALAYRFLENYKKCITYLDKGLDHARKICDLDSIQRISKLLAEAYIESNELTSMESLKNGIIDMVELGFIDPDDSTILQMMSYFNKIGMPEEVEKLIQLILKSKGVDVNGN
ncbi:MAG: helix-turn-helix domain-containing protein [Bacillota bacterium]